MLTLNIKLAEIGISALVNYETTVRFCRDYICEGIEPEITVSVDAADISAERLRAAREYELEGKPMPDFSDAYLETLALYRKICSALVYHGVILMHGSAIMLDGEAFLFTAKSGTGKSTHTRLWRETFGDRAVMVNDDKPLLRVTDGTVTVYGTPWNGKHRLGGNISAPLSAICILTRAEENAINKIDISTAMPHIFTQVHRPDDPVMTARTVALVDRLMHAVPIYRLGCNMSPEAALVSYEGMKKR